MQKNQIKLNNHKWIISQRWSDLLFINFKVSKEILNELIPSYLTLDTFEGEAYTSIVPFKMSNVRFPYLPKLPFASLEELNLRTYVNFKGQKGIFFFTLDSNHLLANFIARSFFNLPYCYRSITVSRNDEFYSCSSPDFKLNARIEGVCKKSEFENFLVERYFLFTDNSKSVFRGQVFHRPWQLHNVNEIEYFESLHERFNIVGGEYHSAFYSRELDVYFKPFEKLIDLYRT